MPSWQKNQTYVCKITIPWTLDTWAPWFLWRGTGGWVNKAEGQKPTHSPCHQSCGSCAPAQAPGNVLQCRTPMLWGQTFGNQGLMAGCTPFISSNRYCYSECKQLSDSKLLHAVSCAAGPHTRPARGSQPSEADMSHTCQMQQQACPLQMWKQLCLITIKQETFSAFRDLPSPSHLLWWVIRKLDFLEKMRFITLLLSLQTKWEGWRIIFLTFLSYF